ncbi:hypothetical protein AMEX_G23806 [Astyanax mexicanus]|uniref:Uncharacterized protein n=1 Tax=Astyanax mexicanus TaxID=7994 RepID=A0A8T2KSM5_ASTMX|nr:hypothetical protein AMEX_G23806 [Astyanax mexicanus]
MIEADRMLLMSGAHGRQEEEEIHIRHGLLRDHVSHILRDFREEINTFKDLMHQDLSSFTSHLETTCAEEVHRAV